MKLEDLKKYITINGGATLTHKGELALLDSGYMVSLAGQETKTTLEALDEHTLKRYQKLARKARAYFGLWLDGGTLYLDLSIKIADKATARRIGKHNGQLAIFDIARQESIYLH